MMSLAALSFFASIPALEVYGAWAKVPIIEVPERIHGATIGKLRGRETLALLHGGRSIVLVSWMNGDWNFETIDPIAGTALESTSALRGSLLDLAAPGGIGVTLGLDQSGVKVLTLAAGGAAQRDGRIRPGDIIEAVAQSTGAFVETKGRPIEEIAALIKGSVGTSVRLRLRAQDATLDVSLERQRISSQPPPRTGVVLPAGPMVVLDGRNDRVERLYLGVGPGILELTPFNGGWRKELIPISGIATEREGMQGTYSRVDGRARIFVNRVYSGPTISTDRTCGSTFMNAKLFECEWKGSWGCSQISEPCWGPFIVNPPSRQRQDLFVGLFKVLTREAGGQWRPVGSFYAPRFIVPSRDVTGRFYTGWGQVQFGDDYRTHRRERQFDASLPMDLASGIAARVEAKGLERVFLASQDFHVYEVDQTTGSGGYLDLGRTPGVAWHLLSGDLRRTGFDHLYVPAEAGNTFEGHGTTLLEYTHFAEASVAAVVGFDIVGDAISSASARMGGRVLGDLLRSEMVKFGHIDVIETDSMDRILAERRFQESQCLDERCLARIGTLLHATASLKGSVRAKEGHFVVSLKVVNTATGRTILNFTREVSSETDIPSAIRAMARLCALEWPHTLGKTRGRKQRETGDKR